jgi:putative hydrolase of the HAD superfamily
MATDTVLFDLDGTLYPAASAIGRMFDERITAYVQRLLGVDTAEALAVRRRYFAAYGTTLRGLQQHHLVDTEDYLAFTHDVTMADYLSPDVELGSLLGELQVARAIFTNAPSEHARRVLHALDIERHFDQVFDIRFFEFHPKPSLHAYRRALEVLRVDPRRVVLIEDTAQNLPPAHALGMTTILVRDPPPTEPPPATDYVVPDVRAAIGLVSRLRQGDRVKG